MDINSAFPSNFLKATDLNGRRVTVTISHVLPEKVGDDVKPCVYFQGAEKGLVLNKTNANEIAVMHGFETDHWVGKKIVVYPTTTDFQGRRVACIRVDNPGSNQQQPAYQGGVQQSPVTNSPFQNGVSPAQPPAQPPASDFPADMDDEIPF